VRYPAVHHVASEARQTFGRFPLVVITGWVCAIAFILDDMSEVLRASLGLPLFLALALFGERRGWSGWRRIALSLVGVAILAAFFVAWPAWSDGVANRRFIQLSVGFHLLVAVLPYVGDPDIDAFWEYNKRLFLRFLIAYLYSMVLFVGLAVAMLAMDNLLGIEFDDSNYMRLWAVVAFIFNTWFFLAGVPKSLELLAERSSYPMGLKVFAQFVLVPLVALYLVILSVYLIKVIVTQQWPSSGGRHSVGATRLSGSPSSRLSVDSHVQSRVLRRAAPIGYDVVDGDLAARAPIRCDRKPLLPDRAGVLAGVNGDLLCGSQFPKHQADPDHIGFDCIGDVFRALGSIHDVEEQPAWKADGPAGCQWAASGRRAGRSREERGV
jgi:hypothetical protein